MPIKEDLDAIKASEATQAEALTVIAQAQTNIAGDVSNLNDQIAELQNKIKEGEDVTALVAEIKAASETNTANTLAAANALKALADATPDKPAETETPAES